MYTKIGQDTVTYIKGDTVYLHRPSKIHTLQYFYIDIHRNTGAPHTPIAYPYQYTHPVPDKNTYEYHLHGFMFHFQGTYRNHPFHPFQIHLIVQYRYPMASHRHT